MEPTPLQIEQARANLLLIPIVNYVVSGFAHDIFNFKFVSFDSDTITTVCEHKDSGRTISFSLSMLVLARDSGFDYGVRLHIDGAFLSQFGLTSLEYSEAMPIVDRVALELIIHANLRCADDIVRLTDEYKHLQGVDF